MCNSDGHKGRPGAEGPGAGQFGIWNGLTCALAEEKTRESIFRALKSRRCYGTSGARIDLTFRIDDQAMGAVVQKAPPHACVFAQVTGTAPIEKNELFQGKDVIETVRPKCFENLTRSNRVRVSWRGSRIRGRGRRVNWDGTIRVSHAKILTATGIFDTPVDGITDRSPDAVSFISQTTGDTDSIDLTLDQAREGTVTFDSKVGRCEVKLTDLTDAEPRRTFPLGGLDISLTIERYPENPTETNVLMQRQIVPPVECLTPYFVKVTQVDGQMAWASPIYLRRERG
jgi:hypothetical protein